MEFSLCEVCRKPLSGGDLCPSCQIKKQEIQRYADAHASAGPVELGKKFGITSKVLRKWVKTGEIRCMTECRFCGDKIRSGELCTKCRTEMASGFKYGNPETKYMGRMHSRNRKG